MKSKFRVVLVYKYRRNGDIDQSVLSVPKDRTLAKQFQLSSNHETLISSPTDRNPVVGVKVVRWRGGDL